MGSASYTAMVDYSSSLFLNKKMEELSFSCMSCKDIRAACAKYIKDGVWLEKLNSETGNNFPSWRDTSFSLDKHSDEESFLEIIFYSIEKYTPSDESNFNMEDLRLFFFSALANHFDITNHKKVEEGSDNYTEPTRIQNLFLAVAAHFGEFEFTTFLSNTSWLREIPPLIDNHTTALTIFKYKPGSMKSDLSALLLAFANSSWFKLFNYDEFDVQNKSINDLMFDKETEKEEINYMETCVKKSLPARIVLTCKKSNGEFFYNLVTLVPIFHMEKQMNEKDKKAFYFGLVQYDLSSLIPFKNDEKTLEMTLFKGLNHADDLIDLLPFIVKNRTDSFLKFKSFKKSERSETWKDEN